MKSITLSLLFLFVMIGSSAAKTANPDSVSPNDLETALASNTDTAITYSITIAKDNPKKALVSMSFIPQDGVLYMAPGADQLPKRWATFVHNLMAVDTNGQPIALEELSDAHWKMPAYPNEKITVSYELNLDHGEHRWSGGLDGVAYTTDWGVFYTGRALLLFNGDERENIRIHFKVAADWLVSTPWNAVEGTKNHFMVDSYSSLRQSMFFAGTQEEFSIKRGDFELVMSLGGAEVIAQKEELSAMAEGVMDYYIDLMGGIPNLSPDDAFSKAIVIINTSDQTDGEVIGNNISMLIEKDGNQMSQVMSRFMFAHEFFHLWNGKSFWPTNNDAEWFKEGFSNYYTLKSLRHIGFLDDASFLDVLNSFFYQRYNGDDGVGTLSMTQGDEKHAHWGLIYGGGFFVGLAQDIIIRKATQNEKSIDDVLRELFKKHGGTDQGYSLADLQTAFSKHSGLDQSDFFATYIIGTQKIPIDTYLSMAGLDATIENGQLRIAKRESATALEKQMVQGMLGNQPSQD